MTQYFETQIKWHSVQDVVRTLLETYGAFITKTNN